MTRHEAQQAPAELVCADRRRHRRQQIEGLEPLWSEERDDQRTVDEGESAEVHDEKRD